ncbi:late histone H2A.2.2-like [Homarus americanus]|uniref:Histone H2A-like 2 n=1 Tax=Homarus americanus TaxID=6706 RepID=A0A8J5K4H8_HOMAM|nr:late histone H2A.2.2-like [Homarus americanus]KAG7167403.1 histone H2A-like 2 [Homarus americanus]
MSGRGNASKRKKRMGLAEQAGLLFPVARVRRYLKEGHYAARISVGASVYFTGILEYLTAEILELASNVASATKMIRITPRHIYLAVRNDTELNDLLEDVTFPEGGVVPHIHSKLLPKTK